MSRIFSSAVSRKAANEDSGTIKSVASARSTLGDFQNRSDVYSYSIVAFEVLFQGHAWGTTDADEIIDRVLRRERPKPFARLEKIYKTRNAELYFRMLNNVIVPCWAADPKDRPTFAAVLEDLEST